jgi:predicted Ser/Thr protein kinase
VAERLFGGSVGWQRAGGAGRSVVCRVMREGRPAACFRLATSNDAPSAASAAPSPFVRLSPEETVTREWEAYSCAAPHGLAPRPIWRDHRAIFSEYIDARPLADEAERGTRPRLALAAEAAPAISRLHAAGVAHMDMSLSNILRDPASGGLFFVDFEYGPARGLTFEQQCLYDYLRLLESAWKFLTPEERREAGTLWDEALKNNAPAAVRAAGLAPLRPALGRMVSAPELTAFMRGLSPSGS